VDGSGAFNCTRAIAAAALTLACACANAADWRYSVGIHDFVVNAVDSDTYGFTASASADERTETGRHWFGSVDLSWDHDQDDLDPDHIPIWWQLHFGSDDVLWQLSSGVELGWTADLDTRINTVSSIERQIHVLPALRAAYQGNAVHASAKAGVGYFFLEIDDDAPKERGYVRADLRNTTVAESLATDATIRLGAAWKLAGRVQGWWDGSEWLQVEYAAELHLAADHSADHSEFVLSAEVNEYNLDVYQVAGAPPILPWDEDLLIKLVFITAW
jgi:hypothetical protein